MAGLLNTCMDFSRHRDLKMRVLEYNRCMGGVVVTPNELAFTFEVLGSVSISH